MAYAFVQQVENSGSGSPKTVSITPTAGNLLFGLIGSDSTGATYGCSDGTNTWIACGVFDGTSIGAGIGAGLFYAKNCSGSTVTVSGSHTGGSITGVYVAEYSGLDTSAPFIASSANPQNGPGSGTDAMTSGNANATSQPTAAIGFYFNSLGQDLMTEAAGTGYTGRTAVWAPIGSAGTIVCARPEDKRVTATGNVAATFTATVGDGGNVFLTVIALFAEAGSIATPVLQPWDKRGAQRIILLS